MKYCIENDDLHGIFSGGDYSVIDEEETIENTAMNTVLVQCEH